MINKKKFKNYIKESINSKNSLLKNLPEINLAIEKLYTALKNKNKVYICGNGGSAADAQHLSAEFLVRLNPVKNRKPFPIISLAMDTSTITACSNDYDFKYLFSRNLEALGNKDDVLIVLTTSGNSKNIIEVVKKAKKMKIFTIGFLGMNGGKVKNIIDNSILVRNKNVARIQETHIFIGHLILEQVENLLLKN